MKKLNKKGFTLAELLIVVAIIAVLVAISIPIFTAQLNKAKYAADEANARSIYAEMVADYLAHGGQHSDKFTLSESSVDASNEKQTITVTYPDKSTNVYNFSGIVSVTFEREAGKYPKVTINPCDKAGVSTSVIFGEGSAATGS